MSTTHKINRKLTIFLILAGLSMVLWKVVVLGFRPAEIFPVKAWDITLEMSYVGYGSSVRIKSFLPVEDQRQTLQEEKENPNGMDFNVIAIDENKLGVWTRAEAMGENKLSHRWQVRTRKERFIVPSFISRDEIRKDDFFEELKSEERIEVDHPQIRSLATALGLDSLQNIVEVVHRIYLYSKDSIQSTRISGETSALTAYQIGEASCNGKSRLAVALLRGQGIPARLVGGIILENEKKKTSHQWVEVWLGNKWVPFCPLNGHYFYTPDNYLVMYRGDLSMFTRTRNINFNYAYDIRSVMIAPKSERGAWVNTWGYLQRSGLHTEVLASLLLIPIGALVTVLFRNMIGLTTFGTFLPALMATAFKDTGLFYGMTGFAIIFGVGLILRFYLNKLKLLHTPKLTILLVWVIAGMMGLTVLGVYFGIREWSQAALFPVAVMSITIERFSIMAEESGLWATLKTLLNTMVVVFFCYLGMMSVFLQMVVLAFPETLLIVIGIAMYLGRWTGLRWTELYRFRHLLKEKSQNG